MSSNERLICILNLLDLVVIDIPFSEGGLQMGQLAKIITFFMQDKWNLKFSINVAFVRGVSFPQQLSAFAMKLPFQIYMGICYYWFLFMNLSKYV